MNATIVEHRAVVQRVEGGRATIAMNVAACASCSEGGCGIGRMAGGRPTQLTLAVSGPIRAGDVVIVALPEDRLTTAALLGYLFPVLAMLLGAWTAARLDGGGDAATALGALAGYVVALPLGRLVIDRFPGVMPSPQLIRLVHQRSISRLSPQEFDHER